MLPICPRGVKEAEINYSRRGQLSGSSPSFLPWRRQTASCPLMLVAPPLLPIDASSSASFNPSHHELCLLHPFTPQVPPLLPLYTTSSASCTPLHHELRLFYPGSSASCTPLHELRLFYPSSSASCTPLYHELRLFYPFTQSNTEKETSAEHVGDWQEPSPVINKQMSDAIDNSLGIGTGIHHSVSAMVSIRAGAVTFGTWTMLQKQSNKRKHP